MSRKLWSQSWSVALWKSASTKPLALGEFLPYVFNCPIKFVHGPVMYLSTEENSWKTCVFSSKYTESSGAKIWFSFRNLEVYSTLVESGVLSFGNLILEASELSEKLVPINFCMIRKERKLWFEDSARLARSKYVKSPSFQSMLIFIANNFTERFGCLLVVSITSHLIPWNFNADDITDNMRSCLNDISLLLWILNQANIGFISWYANGMHWFSTVLEILLPLRRSRL